MRRKIFIILLILLVTIVYLIINSFKFNNVDISMFPMIETKMPTQLTCDWYDNNNVEWDYQEQEREEFLYLGSSESDSKVAQWIHKEDGALISLTIVNYKSPIIAYLYYRLQDPYKLNKDSFSNVGDSNLVGFPSWENKFSSEDTVQCAAGDDKYCNGWFYRARYSQYFLYIDYHGPDCIQSFENITKSINEQFIKFLR
jgi:hypothetical protein